MFIKCFLMQLFDVYQDFLDVSLSSKVSCKKSPQAKPAKQVVPAARQVPGGTSPTPAALAAER